MYGFCFINVWLFRFVGSDRVLNKEYSSGAEILNYLALLKMTVFNDHLS